MNPEQIAESLRRAIRERVYPPGTALIQEDLAKQFGVSRNPVREALRELAADGVIVIRPGEGAIVRSYSRDELIELYDLRIAVEPLIAQAAIDQVGARKIAALRALALQGAEAADVESWMKLNFEFHTELYRIADLPLTETILRSLLSAAQPYSQLHIEGGGRKHADREHLEMVDALASGDSAALTKLIIAHLSTARNQLLQLPEALDTRPAATQGR